MASRLGAVAGSRTEEVVEQSNGLVFDHHGQPLQTWCCVQLPTVSLLANALLDWTHGRHISAAQSRVCRDGAAGPGLLHARRGRVTLAW